MPKPIKTPWTWGKSPDPKTWHECADAMKSLPKKPRPPKEKP